MTTQSLPAAGPALAHRRFAVRFLGRMQTWIWLGASGVLAAGGWWLVAVPARGTAAAERSWALWSGNVLLVLFLATLLFVARKWSIRLPFFRDFGRAPAERADACWAEFQELNKKIGKGAFGSDVEILAAAADTLRRFGVDKIQRAELRSVEHSGKSKKFLLLTKREPFGRLEPWLEMHMGIGTVACLAVFLHADFALRHPIGWTLTVGSMVVLVTGLVGAVLYRVVPVRLAKADAGIPYEEAGVARENYQACIEGVIATLDEKVRAQLEPLVERASTPKELADTARTVLAKVSASHPESMDVTRDLVVMAGSRDNLWWSTAQARRYDFWLRLWRRVHVPVSVALFFVIALHVWAVVWY